jgi:pimeloyl-ACP methyl ester carboxylesterase
VIVFVHGVPETSAIWRKVRAAISRESVALGLPGFGGPRPAGFAATKDAYIDWLLGELDGIDEPIDLVGHDWGALLTYRIATAHGDRLHSWAADLGNLAHHGYEWHAVAKIWQTPGDGEAFIEGQEAQSLEERAAGYELLGVPHDDALEMAAAADLTMGRCILDLYRSATPNPYHHWGPYAPTTAAGLVLHPTEDPFSDAVLASELAATLGARFERIEGAGHFWPYEAPDAAATVLEGFWASVA